MAERVNSGVLMLLTDSTTSPTVDWQSSLKVDSSATRSFMLKSSYVEDCGHLIQLLFKTLPPACLE